MKKPKDPKTQTPNSTVAITLELDARVAELLSVLDAEGDVKSVLLALADHAHQGVYRPGAWERNWITQAFGDDFVDKLVPGDPFGRDGCESIFQKPAPAGTARSEKGDS